MFQVSDYIKESIYRRIRRDLEPSWLIVHTKIGLSIGLGGLTTLFLCGQFGFGLSSLADRVHHALMGVTGFFGCTLVCGILFAVIPVVVLRVISSSNQFQVLIRDKWQAIAGWIFAFGSLIAYQSSWSDALEVLILWGLAAMGSFGLFARLIHRLSVFASHWWDGIKISNSSN